MDESVEAHVPQQRYGSSDEEDDDAPEDGTNPMANVNLTPVQCFPPVYLVHLVI